MLFNCHVIFLGFKNIKPEWFSINIFTNNNCSQLYKKISTHMCGSVLMYV